MQVIYNLICAIYMNSVIHLKIAKDKIEKKVCSCNQKSIVSHISTKQLIL